MPSVQWLIRRNIPQDSLTILAINATSSIPWLENYAVQKGIGYPLIYDVDGIIHEKYEVGFSHGNVPPTYVIIDQDAVIRYRTDNQFDKAVEMRDFIKNLLKGGG